jgi:nucleotide-binding universal stress UspA family protein
MDDQPVLICYDDTDGSRRAIEAAAELLGPRRAVVLDVFPPLTLSQVTALESTGAPGGAEFQSDNEQAAFHQASDGAEQARLAGFSAEPRTVIATPTWQGITQVADEIDAAVIVIGSRGFKGLREAVEGSVSHSVAEHAGRPVLIVPPSR